MNTNINQFRNKVKMAITDEFINVLLDKYINSNVKLLTEKQSIRDLFKFDPSSKGLVNESDFISFKNQLISYELKNHAFNLEDRKQLISEINAKLIKTINKSSQLVFSTIGLLRQDNANDLEHKFIINAPAGEFVNILKTIFDATVANNLDNIRIVTPAITKVKLGYSDSIIVICSTQDLEKTVQMLESISETCKEKCGSPSLICVNVDNWLGYETIDLENRISASKVLSDSFLVALDRAIDRFAKANIIMRFGENNMSFADYKMSFNNINLFRQTILKSYREKLTPIFIDELKSVLESKGVDLGDIFNNDNTKKRCDEVYGVLESPSEVNTETKEEELTISTPVSIMVEEDKKDVIEQEVDSKEDESAYAGRIYGSVRNINPRDMVVPDFLKHKSVEVIDESNVEQSEKVDNSLEENSQSALENMGSISENIEVNDDLQEVQDPLEVAKEIFGENGYFEVNPDEEIPVTELFDKTNESTVIQSTTNEIVEMENSVEESQEVVTENVQPVENVALEESLPNAIENVESVSENSETNDDLQEIQDSQVVTQEIFGENGFAELNPSEEMPVTELFDKTNESTVIQPATIEIVEAMESGNNIENIVVQPTVEEMAVAMESADIQENVVDASIQAPLAEESQLTEEEIASIVDDGLVVENPNVGATYETALKYKDIVRDIAQLNNIVNGTNMTVLQYFEQYDLLNKILPNSLVVMHDDLGGKKSAIDFVSDDLINYLVQNGQGDLDYVIGLYAESIEKEQVAKKSRGLFGLFRK